MSKSFTIFKFGKFITPKYKIVVVCILCYINNYFMLHIEFD